MIKVIKVDKTDKPRGEYELPYLVRGLPGFTIKTGGDDDEEVDISGIFGVKPVERGVIKPTPGETVTGKIAVRDIDKLIEFREKVQIISGVPVYRQCIFTYFNDLIILRHKIICSGVSRNVFKISKILPDENEYGALAGYKMDQVLYDSRDSLTVLGDDYTSNVNELLSDILSNENSDSGPTFYMYDLAEILPPGSLSDFNDLQLSMLFYGFVLKYWPMFTLESFTDYIRKGFNEFITIYPGVYANNQTLIAKYKAQENIFTKHDEMLRDHPPGFEYMNPGLALLGSVATPGEIHENINIVIDNITLGNEEKNWESLSTELSGLNINIRNLFELLHCDDQISIVRANIYVWQKNVTLSKVHKSIITRGQVYQFREYVNLTNFNVVGVLVSPKNAGNIKHLFFCLYNNGKYNVTAHLNTDVINISISDIFTEIASVINPLITRINNLGKLVFNSLGRLELITSYNCRFTNIKLNIVWNHTLTPAGFTKIKETITNDMTPGITKRIIESAATPTIGPNEFHFAMLKSVVSVSPEEIEKYFEITTNYYSYLSNAKSRAKWENVYTSGARVLISHLGSSVITRIENIGEIEFRFIYEYLICTYFSCITPETEADVSIKKIATPGDEVSSLKKLMTGDPQLFDLSMHGSGAVYSRLCQKNNQPVMYNENEKIPAGAIKFWNFTQKRPVYYACPNKKYPYLGFLTGKHPLGYCLPCCKIVSGESTETTLIKNKKQSVYEACTQNYKIDSGVPIKKQAVETTSEETPETPGISDSSRYIKSYALITQSDRLSRLPPLLEKHINFNIKSYYRDYVLLGDKQYSVHEIYRQTRSNKIYDFDLKALDLLLTGINMKNLIFEVPSYDIFLQQIKQGKNITDPRDVNRKAYITLIKQIPDEEIIIYEDDSELDIDGDPVTRIMMGTVNLLQMYVGHMPPGVSHSVRSPNDSGRKDFADPGVAHSVRPPNDSKSEYTFQIRYITKNQLNKCEIVPGVEYSPSIWSTKTKNYYILGVEQGNSGLLQSVARAMRLSPKKLIETVISKLGGKIYEQLNSGIIGTYFHNEKDFATALYEKFIGATPESLTPGDHAQYIDDNIVVWDEIIIQICEIVFDTEIIIIHNDSISNENNEQLYVIIKHRDYNNYIVTIRTINQSKGSLDNYIYYPIFNVKPQEYFRSGEIDQTIFNTEDYLVKTLIKLTDQISETGPYRITFDRLYEFLQKYLPGSNIIFGLQDKKNDFYGLVVETPEPGSRKKNILYVPIYPEYIDGILAKEFKSYGDFIKEISSGDMIDALIIFLKLYNKHTTANIKIHNILIHDNHVIGIAFLNMYSYFPGIKLTDNIKLTNFYKLIAPLLGFDVELRDMNTLYKHLKYDPFYINYIIGHGDTKRNRMDKIAPGLNATIYDKYVYYILVLQIVNKLNNERNTQLRDRLKHFISTFNKTDISALHDMITNQDDFNKIKTLIDSRNPRSVMVQVLDFEVYNFDLVSYNKILEASKTRNQTEIRNIVKKLVDDSTTISQDLQLRDQLIDNTILVGCPGDSSYCDGPRVKISEKLRELYTGYLIDEFMNPVRIGVIMNGISTKLIRNYLNFKQSAIEQLYIKIK